MYKIKGHGIVWDAENNSVLCRFDKGVLETEDQELIVKLEELGYESEEVQELSGVDYDIMKVADLKLLCEEKGIEYDAKAKKDDLVNLLKGAE